MPLSKLSYLRVNSPLNSGCTVDVLNYFRVYIELEHFFFFFND